MFTKVWVLDTVERLVRTFLAAFVAVVLAAGPLEMFSLPTLKAAGLAGIAAAGTFLLAIIGGLNSKPGAGLTVASVPNEAVVSSEVPAVRDR